MTRRPILAGNWKMNLLGDQARELAAALTDLVGQVNDRDVVLIPTYTSLHVVREAIAGTNIALGAQNGYPKPQGAFTGEIAMPMLRDAGCRYVAVGHSERRQFFGETNQSCREKIIAALEYELTPIYCLGEILAEREENATFEVIQRQLDEGLAELTEQQAAAIVIAYEPVWAIGTGKTATPAQAQDVHHFIRQWLIERFGANVGDGLRIQYGGSVKPDNVDELMACPDVDGALVGGAALNADSFARIVRFQTG